VKKVPKVVDQRRVDDLVAKTIKSFKDKKKDEPVHMHTSLKMAQACLDCKGLSQIYCVPVIGKPCSTRTMVLEMVRVRMLF